MYLPKGFDASREYPIIFATDGEELQDSSLVRNVLDLLINSKIIVPLIYVESHCNTQIADSTSTTANGGEKFYLLYRNFEYVDRNPTRKEDSLLFNRFEDHMNYFTNEFVVQIEKELNQSPNKTNRYFYGTSNGAGFGLSMLNANPDIIGYFICFSAFGGDVQNQKWKRNVSYPRLYLKYGSAEPFLIPDAEFLKNKYSKLGLFCEIEEFQGGHKKAVWNREFALMLVKLFTN